jgi:hypothetical protein
VGKPVRDADELGGDLCVRSTMFHENTILQVFMDKLLYTAENRFFESFVNLAVQEFVLRNVSCYDFNLRAPLKMMSANMLSQNDYSESRPRTQELSKSRLSNNASRLSKQDQNNGFRLIHASEDNKDAEDLGDELLRAIDEISGISPVA